MKGYSRHLACVYITTRFHPNINITSRLRFYTSARNISISSIQSFRTFARSSHSASLHFQAQNLTSQLGRTAPLVCQRSFPTMGGPLADIGSNQQRLPKKTVQRNSFVQLQDENSIPTPKKTPEQDSPHYMASTKASISAQATASRSKLPRPAVTPSSFSSTAAKGRAWVALATKRVRSGRGKTPDHSNGALSAVVTARIAKSGVPAISSPLEKRLPSLPIAQISTSSPAKASRTLIDAAERPLRKSPGTPEEAEWPALSPERTSTSSDTARSSSAEHSIQDPEVSHAVEAQFMDKPIAVTVRQSVTDPARTLEVSPTHRADISFTDRCPGTVLLKSVTHLLEVHSACQSHSIYLLWTS